tara:strand:- start:777 stop:1691 length:915 start_codon:yes stop_codon:yes gene_type:complete
MIGLSGYTGLLGSSILRKCIDTKTEYKLFGRNKSDAKSYRNYSYLNLNEKVSNHLIKDLTGISIFIHCAAIKTSTNLESNVSLMNKDLLEFNALYLWDLIAACSKAKVKKIIIISAANALKPNKDGIIDDESGFQTKLNSPYLFSKLIGELLSKNHENKYPFIQIIRPSSIYGPYTKFGLINKFIEKLKNNEEIFIEGDGSWSSDLVYVDDVTEIIYKLFDNYKLSEINIGTGNLSSVLEIANLISQKLNSPKSLIRFNVENNHKQTTQNTFFKVNPKKGEDILNRKMISINQGITKILRTIDF